MPPKMDQNKKRKLDKKAPKYYAVRVGYSPGVYLHWPDCQRMISGYPGASCRCSKAGVPAGPSSSVFQFSDLDITPLLIDKSFLTLAEAEAFVAGQNPGGNSDKSEKYYAVAIGNRPGVYTDWNEAQRAYTGVKGPKYKKFSTRAEAEEFMRVFGPRTQKSTAPVSEAEEDEEDEEDEDGDEGAEEDSSEVDLDDFDEPPAKKAKTAPDGMTEVYTDGSSMGNGKKNSAAGIGVFFGVGDPRNLSEQLHNGPQTNQRAELTAILRALQSLGANEGVRIFSDSKYSISCVCDWYKKWQTSNWTTSAGKEVMNKDLIQPIRRLIEQREKRGVKTEFVWVKGHAATEGNVQADLLAVEGAKMARLAQSS
ncbi:hypothetical protein MCOR25_009376 [Pyricularia grisea]|uniref:Ribonuclease H n=1 Tax=Pyricularia grisea TaxID=148305 RepID=A0A6P8BH24_PYRGI|nr:uncharacterized protein PgNI_00222 [Pyricularia grisea]KAI6352591.1 hypothetical protein MCOR25_009376 [Pyricularia grisea]TLD16171.1 hypothetical protein PgNI_00222 [Pyricularia grisea]